MASVDTTTTSAHNITCDSTLASIAGVASGTGTRKRTSSGTSVIGVATASCGRTSIGNASVVAA